MSGSQDKEFHILRKIAEGGFGAVYLTKLVQGDGFSRLVALKLLHRKWSKNEEVAGRMRDEARLLGWLRHKNIVDVMDLTRLDGRVAVVMEYLEAVDCGTILKNAFTQGSAVPVRAVLEIGALVASALDAAYNQVPFAGEKPLRVIHRDIKPSNIMVDVHGSVKVLDFGVARADFEAREAATQEMSFGSFDYMSSERVFLEEAVPRSDVYSLGATCFELMLTERFGRVRIQKDQHDEMLKERLVALGDGTDVDASVKKKLLALFKELLAFEADDRPSPMDVYKRMRALAREIDEGALEDWAEEVLPAVVEQFQTRTEEGSDPLVGKRLRVAPNDYINEQDTLYNEDQDSEPALSTIWVHQATGPLPSAPPPDDTDPGSFVIPPRLEAPVEEKPSLLAPLIVFGLGLFVLALGIAAVMVVLWLPGLAS